MYSELEWDVSSHGATSFTSRVQQSIKKKVSATSFTSRVQQSIKNEVSATSFTSRVQQSIKNEVLSVPFTLLFIGPRPAWNNPYHLSPKVIIIIIIIKNVLI